ncbi:MAG TPA: hypothetical protein VK864_14905, partial [Longimicrobiales bacterium]|nr:hypothetical protein [Longimicrobiales bacterium]
MNIAASVLGVEVTVDSSMTWARQLLDRLSDVTAASARGCEPLHGAIRIERASSAPAQMRGEQIESGLARTDDALIDRKYGVLLRFAGPETIVLQTDQACAEWFSWSLQLRALHSRATFVHAAGLEQNGRALLLAARHGFGKTGLIGDLIRHHGWRLLGDDLTLLKPDGECHGYPRALVVHPEHQSFFPELFAQGDGPHAPRALSGSIERIGRAVKPLLRRVPGLLEHARRHNPQAKAVLPSRAFGADRIAAHARLHAVIWLERRSDLRLPSLRPAADSMTSRAFSSTIDEFDPWCVRVTNSAMSLGMLDAVRTFGTWLDVLQSGMANAGLYALHVPAALPFEEMPTV